MRIFVQICLWYTYTFALWLLWLSNGISDGLVNIMFWCITLSASFHTRQKSCRVVDRICKSSHQVLCLVEILFVLVWYFVPCGPFYQHGLTLITAWIGNHMPSKVWDEITYAFLNFNVRTRMDKWFHPIHYNGCNYLSMLGLKLNHVSKRAPGLQGAPGLQLGWEYSSGGHISMCVCMCVYAFTEVTIIITHGKYTIRWGGGGGV